MCHTQHAVNHNPLIMATSDYLLLISHNTKMTNSIKAILTTNRGFGSELLIVTVTCLIKSKKYEVIMLELVLKRVKNIKL